MDDVAVVAVADPVEQRRNAAAERIGLRSAIYAESSGTFYDHESRDTLDALIIAIEPTAHKGAEEPALSTRASALPGGKAHDAGSCTRRSEIARRS